MTLPFNQICQFLDEQNFPYQSQPEQERLILQRESLTVVIDVSENGEFVKIFLPQLLTISDDHPHYEAALETLLHLGWQYKLARWQRDPDDGEVRLQADLPLEDSQLTPKQFWRTLQGTLQIALQGRERVQGVLETGEDSGNSENQESETLVNPEVLDTLQQLFEEELSSEESDPKIQEMLQALQQLLTTGGAGNKGGFLALLTEIATEARQGVRESLVQRLDLLTAALEAEYRSNSNPAQVYPVLDSAPQLLDDEFAEALERWGAIALTPQRPEAERNLLAARLENFAIDLMDYPRTHPSILQKLAIVGYQLVLRVHPRETMPHKYAKTLTNLGLAHCNRAELGENPLENLQKAIDAYDQASEIFRNLGLEEALSTTLNNMGVARRNQAELGENPLENLQKAIDAYDQASEIFRNLGLEEDLSTTLNNLGVAHCKQAELGENLSYNLQQAVKACDQATEICRHLELENDLSLALTNLGSVHCIQAELGENPSYNLQQAVKAYDEAAEIRRRLRLENNLSITLNNLGNAYCNQGELGENPSQKLQKAIDVYDEAAEICRRLGLEKDLSTTLNNLGKGYQTKATWGEQPSENLVKAINAYDEAAKILRELRLDKNLSTTLNNLGNAYCNQGELGENPSQKLQKAIDVYDEAAEICRRLGLEKDLSDTLNNLGVAHRIQAQLGENPSQNLQQAITAYDEAAEIRYRLGLEKDLSDTLINLGNAYSDQAELGENPSENRQKAVNCYREVLQFFRPQLLPVECLVTARALGNLGFQQGDWQMALEGYQTAMDAIDYSRTQRLKNAEREEVVAKSIYIYENAIQAAINLNNIPTALEIVERVRAKRLVDLMATADLYSDGNIPPQVQEWLQQLDRLDDQITQKRQEFKDNSGETQDNSGDTQDDSGETQPDKLKTRQLRAATTVSADIAEIEGQKQVILDQIGGVDEVVAKLRQVQPPKLSDFQPLLSEKTAILNFYTTDDDTHIFILRSGESQPRRFTCKGQGYKTLQLWLRETWVRPYVSDKTQWTRQMPDTLAEIAHRLELNRLITEYLQDMEELVIVPHLFLHQIPFVALPIHLPSPTGEGYLGDKFRLRYAPSLQVLGFCHHRESISISNYGTAENATDDLPFSGFEGSKVAELFKIDPQRRLIGAAATRQNYRQLIQQVNRLVSTHHAQSRFDNPQESGLKLSDGTINVSQLFSPGWRFPELEEVFLSCCETGLFVPDSAIDEPVALSTGFLCAGARGVIASQWSIYDCSAALLSILYHEQREGGLNRVQALQAAQQKMRQMTAAEFNQQYKKPVENHLKAEENRVLNNSKAVTRVGDAKKLVKKYAKDKGCPFEHPVHWGALGCYGLG